MNGCVYVCVKCELIPRIFSDSGRINSNKSEDFKFFF